MLGLAQKSTNGGASCEWYLGTAVWKATCQLFPNFCQIQDGGESCPLKNDIVGRIQREVKRNLLKCSLPDT